MKTTGAVITEVLEIVAGSRFGKWVRIADIAEAAGLTAEELAPAIKELMGDRCFRAEPEPMGHRITARDKMYGPMIGGEQRHLVRWEG